MPSPKANMERHKGRQGLGLRVLISKEFQLVLEQGGRGTAKRLLEDQALSFEPLGFRVWGYTPKPWASSKHQRDGGCSIPSTRTET